MINKANKYHMFKKEVFVSENNFFEFFRNIALIFNYNFAFKNRYIKRNTFLTYNFKTWCISNALLLFKTIKNLQIICKIWLRKAIVYILNYSFNFYFSVFKNDSHILQEGILNVTKLKK